MCDHSGFTPSASAARIRPPETPGLLMNVTESGLASRSFCTYGVKSVVAPGSTIEPTIGIFAILAARSTFLAFVAALGTSW